MSEKIPKGWKWVKLGEVAEIVKDIVNPNEFDDLNYIGLEHIGQENLRIISIGKSREVNSTKYLFKPNDILFGKLRPYFRKVVKPKFNGICSTDIWVFRAKQGYDQNYLYYFLANWDFVNLASSGEGGTRMPRADWNYLKQTEWIFPPLPEQKAIAEVLSSIDDKIDLLHRQNKTLEEMAMTLFRQWFMGDNISNDIIELGSLVDIISGISYKSTDLNPSTTAMVSLKCFDRNGEFRIDGFKEFTGNYKEQHIVKEGDLIVAHTDITQDAEVIGNPAIVISNPKYTKMVISMDIVKVIPKVNWISIEFLYFLMRTREFKGHCEGSANGSTVLHLSKQAIPTFEFKTPKREMVIEFTKQAKELLNKTFLNQRQILTLIHLRDTLLPKLMSGEVRVKF